MKLQPINITKATSKKLKIWQAKYKEKYPKGKFDYGRMFNMKIEEALEAKQTGDVDILIEDPYHKAENRVLKIKFDYVPETFQEEKDFKRSEMHYDFLKEPKLFENIIEELDKKIEEEEKSKKSIFLSLCSIWVKNSEVPLNTLVSSESSVGKSFVCKNIIKLFPEELYQYRTKLSPEAFTYWKMEEEDWTWDGKICYLEDISQSLLDSQTFKVMCSEGSIASVVNNQKTIDIEIKGKPVMLVTTARTNPNTEILNRFQIVSLDETKNQSKRIVFRQAKQRKNIKFDPKITESLRLLKREEVFIPFAEQIAQFLDNDYGFEDVRIRRDFSRLLDLVRCSTTLYQFQRERNEENVLISSEVDYEIAREVINYIQGQTFKGLIHKLKKSFECCKSLGEFTAAEIHSKYPIANLKSWYGYLDSLLERKLLKTELRDIEGIKKDGKKYITKTTVYSVCENKSFILPPYNELTTIATIDTNDTKDTKDTKGLPIVPIVPIVSHIAGKKQCFRCQKKFEKLIEHGKEKYCSSCVALMPGGMA